jgi:beta-mannosidase
MRAQKWGGTANSPPRFYGEPIYEQVLPILLAELEPGRRYIPTSPTGKPPEDSGEPHPGGINCGVWGDSHYSVVWHGRGDWKYDADSDTRLSSEFGFASSCSLAQWDRVLAPGDRDSESAGFRWHDDTNKAWEKFRGYATTHYPEPVTLEDWVYFSQLNQRDALRFGIEHYRRSEFCRGTLIWQFNDCWPVQSWAVQDFLRLLKPAGYELARLYADQLVSLVVAEERVDVHVMNDGTRALDGGLLLEVLSPRGAQGLRREADVHMGAGERGVVHSEARPTLAPDGQIVRATVTTKGGELSAVALLAEPMSMRLELRRVSATVKAGILLQVEGVALDLVLYDPDNAANVRPETVRLPGWSAATFINESRAYSFADRPQRLVARSLAGLQDVKIVEA